jgi:ADP-heptose:LPS heptosyltransferase
LNGKRLLVVRFSGLGDVVLTLPAVRALRRAWPGAHISWMVSKSYAAILEGNPDLDEVIPLNLHSITDRQATLGRRLSAAKRFVGEVWRMRRELRARPFDVVIEFQNLMKCAAFTRMNRKAVRVGFRGGGEPTHWFLHHTPVQKDTTDHAVNNYLRLAHALGGDLTPVEFPIDIPAAATERAAALLADAGVGGDDRVLLVCPFARRDTKLWPRDRMAEACRRIVDVTGARPVCAPGPGDMAEAERLVAAAGDALTLVPGTSLKELCALLQRAACFFGIDGGQMHLAGALGTPVLALFGPTNRKWIGPWGEVAGPFAGTALPRAVAVQPPQPDPTTRKAKRAAWTDTSVTSALTIDDVLDPLTAAYGALLRGEEPMPERPAVPAIARA